MSGAQKGVARIADEAALAARLREDDAAKFVARARGRVRARLENYLRRP